MARSTPLTRALIHLLEDIVKVADGDMYPVDLLPDVRRISQIMIDSDELSESLPRDYVNRLKELQMGLIDLGR